MKTNFNITLTEQELYSKLGYSNTDKNNTQMQENVIKAVQEINRGLNVSFVYNVEVDLEDFKFKYYEAPFELRQLSFGAVSLGEDIETTLNLYRKKEENTLCMLMETGIEIMFTRLLDNLNFHICNENYEEFKQGPRKITRDNLILKKEEKGIAEYLDARKIGIKFNDEENIIPHFSRIFIIEWAARKNKTPELAGRCNNCGALNCQLRIEK